MDVVSREAGDHWLFQLYVFGDLGWVRDYLQPAVELGVKGFSITVDSDYCRRRESKCARSSTGKWSTASAPSPICR